MQNAWLLIALALGICQAAQIEPALARKLVAASPSEKLAVAFVMDDQVEALILDPNIPNLPKPERRARVARVLMDYAAASQHNLREYLNTQEATGNVDGLNSLWIVNEVACFATPDVIRDVADRSDVAVITSDVVPVDLGVSKTSEPPTPRDIHEPNLDVIQAPAAWHMGYTGQNVVLGIIDTGIWYTHLDLRNHLWQSPAYPHCGFNYGSYQLFPSASNPSPYDSTNNIDYAISHGTFCAGIASADGAWGNGSHDTMGVAPSARILACCCLVYYNGDNAGETLLEQSVLLGLQFCLRPPRDTLNGADVISTSLGIPDSYHPRYANYRFMERNIAAAGLPHAVVAGSEGPTEQTIRCPGDCPPPWPNPANNPTDTATSAVLTVGCTDNSDNVAQFSSHGPTTVWGNVPPFNDYAYPPGLTDPDVMAPGVNVTGPYYGNDSSYTTMSGTSWSTAAIGGCIALMLSKNPLLSPREVDSIIELYGVRDLGTTGKDNTYGAGRINCSLALAFTPGGPVGIEKGAQPLAPSLELEAFPNPSKGSICLRLTADSPGRHGNLPLRIFNQSGRLVRTLIPRPSPLAPSTVTWDGTDNSGRPVAEGCYFCELRAGGRTIRQKLLLTR